MTTWNEVHAYSAQLFVYMWKGIPAQEYIKKTQTRRRHEQGAGNLWKTSSRVKQCVRSPRDTKVNDFELEQDGYRKMSEEFFIKIQTGD